MSQSNIIQRKLGRNGPLVNALGFGGMGLSVGYGPTGADDERQKVIKKAVELGSTFIDTADAYGDNEQLLGTLLKDAEFRSKVFICTKFALAFTPTGMGVRGDRQYVREACEASLKRLNVDYIDLYYQHRVDRSIPIEETWKELAELQKEGKIKYLGISEATSEEIRRAHAVAPISAYQVEFSPWTPDIRENGLLDTCRELGITIVAYSPLGRGFLTGAYKTIDDLDPNDWRRTNPRFQGEAFKENLKFVDLLTEIAKKKGVTPSQLVLAWVLAQGEDFVTIPGTKKEKYLIENMGALNVKLTTEEIAAIDDVTKKLKAIGDRYNEKSAAF